MNPGPGRGRQQGQVMVLFILGIFAIIGMVAMGTVGSSTEESFDVVAAGLEPEQPHGTVADEVARHHHGTLRHLRFVE